MSFTFRPAKRENVPLLLGVAGGTGSGKTMSALRLAKGIANGQAIYVIDTENGRAKHYADDFEFLHGELHAPFQPLRYAEAIKVAETAGAAVIVVDSTSHEHAGDGGLLDMQEAELERMAGQDYAKRERVKMAAWIRPKREHKQFVTRLLQLNAHVILCFRAEEKIEIVRVDGKTEIRPKQSLVGLDGWVPISEKNLPYELTASFLLTPDKPGVPKPIKLQEQHKPFVKLDAPLDEATGSRLAEWARGASSEPPAESSPDKAGGSDDVDKLTEQLLTVLKEIRQSGGAVELIADHRAKNDDAKHIAWLQRQIANAEQLKAGVPA